MNFARLAVVYFGAALTAWALILMPVIAIVHPPDIVAFFGGVLVGGLTGPLLLLISERVRAWVLA